MNIVRELRIKKGIQQKELALELGVSNAAVSNWEKQKSDPSGVRLKRLAAFFEVDELTILGKNKFTPFVPNETGNASQTDQIIQRLLQQLDNQPKTSEARILAKGVDRLPQEQREQALNVFRAVFSNHADYFEKGKNDDT